MTHPVPHLGTQTVPAEPEPIGRDADLAVLTDAHRDLLGRGRGAVIWLAGEAGIGASALVRAFVHHCQDTTATMHTARAAPADTGDLAVLYRLLGIDGGAAQTTANLVAHVRTLCAAGPLVLILEDLDHADDASLFVWTVLSRSTTELPLLLIGTCHTRPYQERIARMREALRLRGARVVDLRPLSEPDLAALAARHLHAPPGPRLASYLYALGGNPARALALLAALGEAGLIGKAGARVELRVEGARSAALLNDAVRAPLPPSVTRILSAAALAGPAFDAAEIGALSGDPPPQVAASLSAALDHAVLRPSGDRMVFQHEVVRAAAAGALSPTQRRTLHRDAAAALLAAGADAPVIARHFVEAGPVSPAAIRWLLDLGDPALLADPGLFAALLALAADSPDHIARVALGARHAELEHWLGHYDTAARIAEEIAAQASGSTAGAMTRLAARAQIRSGHASAVADRHCHAIESRLVAWHAVALTTTDRAEDAQRRIAELGAPDGNDPVTAVTIMHATVRAGGSVDIGALRRWRDRLPGDIESRELRALAHIDLLDLVTQTGPAEEQAAAIDEAIAVAADAGPIEAAAVRASAERAAYLVGRWDVLAGTGADSLVSARRQRISRRAVVTGRTAMPVTGEERPWWEYETEAVLAELADRSDDALAARSAGFLKATAARPARLHGAEHLVRLALAAGDIAGAATVVQRCTRIAAEQALPVQIALSVLVTAMLTGDSAALLRAAGDLHRLGAPLQSAAASEEAAVRLALARERTDAGRALRDAVAGYAAVGAAWDVARADGRLREHGIRRRAPADRPTTGWAALTQAEFRVLRLLARGMSNRDIAEELFLSQNTVQTHLSRIRDKLGLRSRMDIVRAASGELRP